MRPTPEVLLISAMLNTGQVEYGEGVGITPDMFVGHQNEYRWLLSYRLRYGQAPSVAAFMSSFPGFPHVSDITDVEFAADEVRYEHTRRSLRSVVRSAAHHISEGDIEQAMLAVQSFAPPGSQRPIVNAMKDTAFLDDYATPFKTLPTPWPSLQRPVGGIRAGDLWIVAARLGQGKSWTLLSFMAELLLAGYRVGMYSLEMSQRQVLTRMHVALGARLGYDVDHVAMRDRVFDRGSYSRLVDAIQEQVPGFLHVHDSAMGRVSPATVSAQADNFDLVVVDYVGLMVSPVGTRAVDDWRNMAAISNMLKEVAVAKDIPILGAAQINRDGDTNQWKPPQTKNLSQSDALGQDADVVITHKRYSKSTMVYLLDKNRHGESGEYWWTRFSPNKGRFEEITRNQADDIRDSEVVD